jgi:hypothetical protein
MTVSKFTEGFGFIEAATKLLDDNDSNKQRAETIRQGIMRILACYDENEMKPFSSQAIVLDSKSQSGTRVSSLVLSGIGHNDADDLPTVQEEVPTALHCHTFVTLYMCKFFSCTNVSFYWSNYSFWTHLPHFKIAFI